MLEGLMQDDFPLTLHHPLHRMRSVHPGAEVVTLTDAGVVRATYGEVAERVDRLARVLGRLGVYQGDRVGTFAWNNQRHLELYFAVPCVGAVLHTLNIRLFAEQLTYIVNHAEDSVIFVDDSARADPRAAGIHVPGCAQLHRHGQRRHRFPLPNVLRYEELLEEAGAGALRLPRARRAPGRRALLHERHHRQPQGRALLPPLDLAALNRFLDDRRARPLHARPRARGGADVPRQRLGHPARGRARRRRPDHARPLPCRPSRWRS